MSSKALCDQGYVLNNFRTDLLSDEFNTYASAGVWTTTTTNSGTAAADDTGGVTNVLLTTGTTTGNFTYVNSTKQPYLMQAQHPMFAQGRLYNFTNQATTNGFVIYGFASTTTLTITSQLDPTASYSGAVIYKRQGDVVWSCQSSNGATKTTNQSVNAFTNAASADLRIDVNDYDANNAEVTYMVNGAYLQDSNGRIIKHVVAYASLVKMNLIMGTLAGSNNAQTASFDLSSSGMLRNGLN